MHGPHQVTRPYDPYETLQAQRMAIADSSTDDHTYPAVTEGISAEINERIAAIAKTNPQTPAGEQIVSANDVNYGLFVREDGDSVIIRSRMDDEGYDMAHQTDMTYCLDFIKKEPEIAALFGYQIKQLDGGGTEVTAPTAETLNAAKEAIPARVPINRAKFVDVSYEDGQIPMDAYLQHIANGEIPIADAAHDWLAHGLGWATMGEKVFDHISKICAEALKSGSEKQKKAALGLADRFSNEATILSSAVDTNAFATLLADATKGMGKLFTGVTAGRAIREQRQVFDQLRNYIEKSIDTPDSKQNEPYPQGWDIDYIDIPKGITESRWLSGHEIADYSAYAQAWLADALGERPGPISVSETDQTYDPDSMLYQFKRTQGWGGIDEPMVRSAGPSVEFGGPSDVYDTDILPGFTPDHVSNVTASRTLDSKSQIARGPVDFVADVRNTPFAAESVGSVKVKSLTDSSFRPEGFGGGFHDHFRGLRSVAIQEATRILKPGGYLVWERGRREDYFAILEAGLEPVAVKVEHVITQDATTGMYTSPSFVVNGVYQKRARALDR